MVGFGKEFEWRRRQWPTGRPVAEREGASGRESAEMREKKERGKKEMNRDGTSPKQQHVVAITTTSCRESDGLPSPEAGSLSHAVSGQRSAIV